MKIADTHYRTIWVNDDGWSVSIIDQTKLPHTFETTTIENVDDAARAIKTMQVRGAPLIGATAAYGICLGIRDDDGPGGEMSGGAQDGLGLVQAPRLAQNALLQIGGHRIATSGPPRVIVDRRHLMDRGGHSRLVHA